MTTTENTNPQVEQTTDTLDLLAQVLDSAYEVDLLTSEQYDEVSALVWGALARYADPNSTAAPVYGPAVVGAALDALAAR